MNSKERLNRTLNFEPVDHVTFMETVPYYEPTIQRWRQEGLPCDLTGEDGDYKIKDYFSLENIPHISVSTSSKTKRGEKPKILEETDTYTIYEALTGCIYKLNKKDKFFQMIRPPVTNQQEWEKIKLQLDDSFFHPVREVKSFYEAHKKNLAFQTSFHGFFWYPRTLLGDEEHLMAFYDKPDLLKDMNQTYCTYLLRILKDFLETFPVDFVYISEDMSYRNGSMISEKMFSEFIAPYYKQIVPLLRKMGVNHIFVDTDGNFTSLIPLFLDLGIDGFIPVEVQAGMDVVEIRKHYPKIRLIGGVDKMKISKGKEGIESEIKRIFPVVKQGGYIPGFDHQVPPEVSLEDYKHYLKRLRSIL